LYDQGIDLLITNKISNTIINTDLSESSLASSNHLLNSSEANSLNLDETSSALDLKSELFSNNSSMSQTNILNSMKTRSKEQTKSETKSPMNLDDQANNRDESNFSIDTQLSSLVNFDHGGDKRFSESSFPASISFLKNPTVMPPPLTAATASTSNNNNNNNNNAGYCVDSVEPKCNELKRLIDEFRFSYMQKLSIFKSNKIILKKLNLVSGNFFCMILNSIVNV
jgi:hypothetical protein